jgi:hypothetical protein
MRLSVRFLLTGLLGSATADLADLFGTSGTSSAAGLPKYTGIGILIGSAFIYFGFGQFTK